jgi:hypothetical protein
MWKQALRFFPGGIAIVEPRKVISRASVASYRVYPHQLGLAQLIGSGAIERTQEGALRIVKPIAHLPPEMGGGHSAGLIVAKGIPMPPGDPVHSCLFSEDTGKGNASSCDYLLPSRLRPANRR